jgi:hypothetical protein
MFHKGQRSAQLQEVGHHTGFPSPGWFAHQGLRALVAPGLLDLGEEPHGWHGPAAFTPEVAFAALGPQGPYSRDLPSMTRLSPRETLAAFGLCEETNVSLNDRHPIPWSG